MLKTLMKRITIVVGIAVLGVLVFSLYYRAIVERKDPVEAAPPTTSFIEVDGEQLAYRLWDRGASTTVVFIGGLSAWNGTWERTIEALALRDRGVNLLALDLPPFGYSTPDPTRGYFRITQADRIEAFIQKLELEHVVLVLHSYGAGPGMEYAMRRGSPIERAIVIDGVLGVGASHASSSAGIAGIESLRNTLVSVLFHNRPFAASRIKSFTAIPDHVDRPLVETYVQYGDVEGVTPRLGAWLEDYLTDPLDSASTDPKAYQRIAFPVRLIWGEVDTLTPISDAETLLTIIPDVRLFRLAGVGHMPMIEDIPAFDEALFRALRE